MATWPRTDPPPFPPEQLRAVTSPIDANLPREQLERIAAFIRWYERDPFDPTIGINVQPSIRATLIAWLAESPDVSVVVTVFLSRMTEGRGGDPEQLGAFVTVGSTLGMAADAIENPSRAPESAERQAAGIESALRWYEAAVARGAARNGFLDQLIEVRERGDLAVWFAERVSINQ
ncbi:MAG: hypothetical protein AAF645_16405 [Myxococcota bacterium]